MVASTTHRDLGDKIPRTLRERESREKNLERKRRRNSNLKSAGKLIISKNVAQIIGKFVDYDYVYTFDLQSNC